MADETRSRKVKIDLDEIWEPAGVGILRGRFFAGLGTNAARDPNLTNFDLPGLMKFLYSRSVPNPEEIKLEFERWILANAFREAVESFALALDRSYEALLAGEWVKTGKRPKLSKLRTFFHGGVERKLEVLCAEFGVTTAIAPYFVSLNKARNCLAHRMGVVGPMDLTEGNALVVRYRRMKFVIIEDTGREETIPVDTGGTFRIESPCHRAEIRFEEEERRFALGARLFLEPSDVNYIFWTLNRCGIELKSSITAKLREDGVSHQESRGRYGYGSGAGLGKRLPLMEYFHPDHRAATEALRAAAVGRNSRPERDGNGTKPKFLSRAAAPWFFASPRIAHTGIERSAASTRLIASARSNSPTPRPRGSRARRDLTS